MHKELISVDQLHELHSQTAALKNCNVLLRPSASRSMGDQHSGFVGRGLDFEELRRYVPGDDLRNLEWRATARSGMPYVRVHREERRASLYLVLDRRAGMRFATRGNLKVSQAARIAMLFAFLAMRKDMAVGGATLDTNGQTLRCEPARQSISKLVSLFNAPCPPLSVGTLNVTAPMRHGEPDDWQQMLENLENLLEPGSHVAILSDFAGFKPVHVSSLAALAFYHQLTAIRILDPVEVQLPEVGAAIFEDLSRHQRRLLNTSEQGVRAAFAQTQAERQADQAALFAQAGVRLRDCVTTDDAFNVFRELVIHG